MPIISAIDERGTGLRLEFVRRDDRYAHQIEFVDGPATRLCCRSLEGSSDDIWPPSPPLQQLHFEPRGDGQPVALLVGMAGKSHWSMSVEAEPAARCFVFDVACRLAAAPACLSSRYGFEETPVFGAESGIVCVNDKKLFFEVEDTTTASIVGQDNALAIVCRDASDRFPATARWKYRIGLQSDVLGPL